MPEQNILAALQAENARLVALLAKHGIDWRLPSSAVQICPASAPKSEPPRSKLSTADKVALFRRLFRGRTDVYPVRWEAKTSGKSGYAPACANEWRAGVASFDAILKKTKAKLVLGLTATPIGRDGQQAIIFMQCGPTRHTATRPANAPHDLEVLPRSRFARIDLPSTAGIQDVFRHLANDLARTQAIAAEVAAAFEQGRKVLVLTERTEHLDAIVLALTTLAPPPFVLHGRMSKKQRAALIAELDALPPHAPRILIATGKLVGEGFDHPPLDTLVLAMPVSWKGTRCSSTLVACIANMLPRPMCGSSTSSTLATLHCCGCGTSGSEVTEPWGIAWAATQTPMVMFHQPTVAPQSPHKQS